jgi:hypothetical protein
LTPFTFTTTTQKSGKLCCKVRKDVHRIVLLRIHENSHVVFVEVTETCGR